MGGIVQAGAGDVAEESRVVERQVARRAILTKNNSTPPPLSL